jgi:hypothetical protein
MTAGVADDRARELLDELSEARDAATRIRDIVRDLKIFYRSPNDAARGPVNVETIME